MPDDMIHPTMISAVMITATMISMTKINASTRAGVDDPAGVGARPGGTA